MRVGAPRGGWWRGDLTAPAALAAIQLALHLALNGRYGLHTDELYYILSGRHPALGYVDYPPVTPLLARLDTSIFGVGAWTLRLLPALTGAAMVFLTGLCARELGGGRRAMALASAAALVSPYLLATWLFQTVEFDELVWLIAIYLLLRILRTGDRRLYLLLGLDLGVGLETKTTVVVLCVASGVAVLSSRELRPALRTPWPWAGLAVAAALAAPNLSWQVANGFPTLTYISNHRSDIAQSGGAAGFTGLFLLLVGPLLLPLWVAGLVHLARDGRLRPLLALVALAILLFLPEGKAYYPAPTVPFTLAAGTVAVDRLASARRRRWLQGLLLAGGVLEAAVFSPIVLPVVPPSALHTSGVDKLNADFANMIGWPEMTAQVGAVYDALPSGRRQRTAILAAIAGQAGALDIYGGPEHLPPALSPQLSFWYWKPQGLDPDTLVTVGYSPGDLAFLCGSVKRAGTVRIQYGIENLNQGSPILVCADLKEPLGTAWSRLKNFS